MKRQRQKLTHFFIIILVGALILGCSGIQQGKDLVFKVVNRGQLLTDAATAYRAGNFAEAGKYYKKVLIHNQDDAIVAYNLACCYALQGDATHAALFVTHAFQNGFRGLEIFNKDTDFDLVREDPDFQKATIDIQKRFDSIGTRNYVEASSMLPYRMRFPKEYDANKSYPLLIGMHGMGGNSEGFISQYDKLIDPQIIYVAPEGQYPISLHMAAQWHRRKWSINDIGKEAWNASDAMVGDYILKTIEKVSDEYKISDVYIMGFSEGAVYAYTIGLKNPDKIKGVIGFSGYLMDTEGDKTILNQQDIETGKDVRLFIAHGIDDAAIKVETARELSKMFESKGFDLTYTEFEGRHGIKADVFNDAVKWMQL
ncbi:MAG: hypothetical protein HN995_14425 [Candidatus Marinimicrobia bacterium]|jgi:phospholipase/carboxylesterase|nr:hypothetical protein [Candidatus Neomarinimicrobiota bacterium]MBT3575469.1 hypothetical protein [Candidatus Neomarinimicrobiota bacterium]MBT3679566.1 hypothetical protein [Candidatus Neomarinimicrobiota bacterium]MBT3950523.1 hypothetical protein [Candidatus Neomarinimicrobiota bacterium]MBT4253490.1 hypothetical protein [Candidatus Neomarinimicrobiota bacterium]